MAAEEGGVDEVEPGQGVGGALRGGRAGFYVSEAGGVVLDLALEAHRAARAVLGTTLGKVVLTVAHARRGDALDQRVEGDRRGHRTVFVVRGVVGEEVSIDDLALADGALDARDLPNEAARAGPGDLREQLAVVLRGGEAVVEMVEAVLGGRRQQSCLGESGVASMRETGEVLVVLVGVDLGEHVQQHRRRAGGDAVLAGATEEPGGADVAVELRGVVALLAHGPAVGAAVAADEGHQRRVLADEVVRHRVRVRVGLAGRARRTGEGLAVRASRAPPLARRAADHPVLLTQGALITTIESETMERLVDGDTGVRAERVRVVADGARRLVGEGLAVRDVGVLGALVDDLVREVLEVAREALVVRVVAVDGALGDIEVDGARRAARLLVVLGLAARAHVAAVLVLRAVGYRPREALLVGEVVLVGAEHARHEGAFEVVVEVRVALAVGVLDEAELLVRAQHESLAARVAEILLDLVGLAVGDGLRAGKALLDVGRVEVPLLALLAPPVGLVRRVDRAVRDIKMREAIVVISQVVPLLARFTNLEIRVHLAVDDHIERVHDTSALLVQVAALLAALAGIGVDVLETLHGLCVALVDEAGSGLEGREGLLDLQG